MATNAYGNSIAKAIYFGDVKPDGSFPTLDEIMSTGFALTKIAAIEDNSDEAEYQTIKAKEDGSTITRIMTSEGAVKYTIEVFDLSAEIMQRFLGATSANGEAILPTNPYEANYSMMIVQKEVEGLHVVRMHAKVKVSARLMNDFADDNIDRVQLNIEVLTPKDSAGMEQPAIKLLYVPGEPTITSVVPGDGTSAGTMDFSYIIGFDQPGDYEWTSDGGATWNDVTAKPISDTAIQTGLSPNTLGIRVKAGSAWKAGFVAWYPYST